jgi:hypothetical protein
MQMAKSNPQDLTTTTATRVVMLMTVCRERPKSTRHRKPRWPLMSSRCFPSTKGIRLGMTAQEVRTKLGDPKLKADDQDYYIFSDTESAQFAYDTAHKVVTISIDYTVRERLTIETLLVRSIDQTAEWFRCTKWFVTKHKVFGFSYAVAGASGTVTITIQKIFTMR